MKKIASLSLAAMLALTNCSKKSDEIHVNNPNEQPTPARPLSKEQTEGVYRMKVIRIDVRAGYSYYSYPADTNLIVSSPTDENLSFYVLGQAHQLNYQGIEDEKYHYQIDNYSPNYGAFANFIAQDPDSMYFYTSQMTGGNSSADINGVKFIFSGRKQPW